jgi:hypothetical protein
METMRRNGTVFLQKFGLHSVLYKEFAFPEPDEPRFRLAVMASTLAQENVAAAQSAVPRTIETAEPSNRCIGVSNDGTDALANLMGVKKYRSHFRMPSRMPPITMERAMSEKDPSLVRAYLQDVLLECLNVIRDTGGKCCGGDIDGDIQKLAQIQEWIDLIDDKPRTVRAARTAVPVMITTPHPVSVAVDSVPFSTTISAGASDNLGTGRADLSGREHEEYPDVCLYDTETDVVDMARLQRKDARRRAKKSDKNAHS